jgi:hypothetical protein
MKNLLSTLLVINLWVSSNVQAQCVIPAAIEASIPIIPSNFYLDDDVTESGFSSYGTSFYYHPNDVQYWGLGCGVNPVGFTYWSQKNANTKVEMYCEIIGQKFNCDGTLNGAEFIAHTTPIVQYTGSASSYMYAYFSFEVDPNTYYRVKATSRKKLFGIWAGWYSEESKSITFGEPVGAPNPDGYFLDELSVEPRTSSSTLWEVDVHQLDIDANFYFDAGPTTCEDRWHYEISEFNLDPWTATNTVSSTWIGGNAGIIDMASFYSAYGFVKGKLYILKLVAGNGWYEKFFWFEIKDATLVGTILPNYHVYSHPTLEDGEITYHEVFLLCEGDPVNLVTTGTENVDVYRVRVAAVDANFDLIEAEVSTGILSAPVPGSIDIENLYGSTLITGQRYRVVYEVSHPGSTALYYVKKGNCGGGGGHEHTRGYAINENSVTIEEENSFTLYPNPVKDLVTIKMDEEKTESASIEIFNQLGQVIRTGEYTISNGVVNVDLSDLPIGLYTLRLVTSNGVSSQKFLKE